MRLALAATLLLTGCATEVVPAPSAASGSKRVPTADTPHRVKHQRQHSPRVSRSLHRLPWGHDWHRLSVTAYCYTGSRNAAGKWPTTGTAAANAYPLGTRLQVQDIGMFVVEDRSAPGSTDVDLYLGAGPDCLTAATQFGRRELLVRVAA